MVNSEWTEDMLEGLMFERAGDYEQAFKLYKNNADKGSRAAMYAIGNLYFYKKYRGVEIPQMIGIPWNKKEYMSDYKTAFSWYLKSAERGYSDAMNAVGIMFYTGTGCKKDKVKAHKWLAKSAAMGNRCSIRALNDFFGEDHQIVITDEEYDNMLDIFF